MFSLQVRNFLLWLRYFSAVMMMSSKIEKLQEYHQTLQAEEGAIKH